MTDALNARDNVGDGSLFTRVAQDYEEDLEGEWGSETRVEPGW